MYERVWLIYLQNDGCENLDNFSDISFDMAFVYT